MTQTQMTRQQILDMQDGRHRLRTARARELEEENARLKVLQQSSWQRGYAFGVNGLNEAVKGFRETRESYLDENERLTNALLEAEDRLAASQLRETQLRAALEDSGRLYCTMIGNELMSKPSMFERSEVCKFVRGWFREMQPTIIQKTLALPRDTSALDVYVAEKVKEAMK